MKVGIVGCGVISRHYAKNAAAFDSFELVACADVDRSAAESLAAEHGLTVLAVDELIEEQAVDVILNLTPASVHAAVTRDALAAGKHVYSEKPLATTTAEAGGLVDQAERLGLRLGCAPDTFLGRPHQAARELIDAGGIGVPLSVTAAVLVGSQAAWHPNPDIFYADGAGPLLDMGPYYLTSLVALLGPVVRVAGFASTRVAERVIEIGPRTGERFTATTPTHTAATLELENGATANLVASFEAPGQYVSDFLVHGSEGVLRLPDPNAFAGPLRVRRGRGSWRSVRSASTGPVDARGLGLQDMVDAIAEGRPHRASGRLAHHVVDIARTILAAAAEGRTLELATSVERPAALPLANEMRTTPRAPSRR